MNGFDDFLLPLHSLAGAGQYTGAVKSRNP